MSIIQEALRKSQNDYLRKKTPEPSRIIRLSPVPQKIDAQNKIEPVKVKQGKIKSNKVKLNRKENKLTVFWFVSLIILVIMAAIAIILFLSYVSYRLSVRQKIHQAVQLPPAVVRLAPVTEETVFEPVPQANAKQEGKASVDVTKERPPNFILNGIMHLEDGPKAIINGYIVDKGDKINGATVMDINEDSVLVSLDDSKVKLKLSK